MDAITENYILWLMAFVSEENEWQNRYSTLIHHLFNRPYTYSIVLDKNREADGLNLRSLYAAEMGCPEREMATYINGTCSVLEMLIALSVRIENSIMEDMTVGPKPGIWFWTMLTNLDLDSQTDENFDNIYVSYILDDFLDGRYSNTKGGIVKINNTTRKINRVDLWTQVNWYLCELYL